MERGKERSWSEVGKYPQLLHTLGGEIGRAKGTKGKGGEQGAGEAGRIAEVALTSQHTRLRLGPYPLPTNPNRAMHSSALVNRREWIV
ncbi:uncharacterized protein BO96DRAFT_430565 [Aspergillus niger CBS 101883]|uniref:uncharacterized protein n=1 Tax=Aspergillus lacticoffeatus (strain CBS 101883) TaxID=1450533 RepID=UPI000D80217F|nr:uncharacterized protein BO96DRAFT_430565 [Aspergillus niger CBS 101883]PYH60640.1 hypothetical protein BO96DRAFT_430565 [Aspergillus niger CBS 101883]